MHQPRRILLVEDTPELREDLALELQDAGYQVFEAADGQTALSVCATQMPDLIICDIQLPDMDGLSVVASIRAAPGGTNATPVIVVSAFSDPKLHHRVGTLENTDFVVKPVDYAELLKLIEQSLMAG